MPEKGEKPVPFLNPENHGGPPEGWLTVGSFSKEIEIGKGWITNAAEPYRESNPEWFFKTCATPNGRQGEYLAPELQAALMDKYAEYGPAPEDWVTVSKFREEMEKSHDLVQKLMEPFRETNPEWIGEYRTSDGIISEHISPELSAALTEKIGEPAPEGWRETVRFAKELGSDSPSVGRWVEPYRETNPEWFGTFRARRGAAKEHIAPELQETIEAEYKRFGPAPDEWVTAVGFAAETGWEPSTVKRVMEKYRDSNPEYFRAYKTFQGRVVEHISLECQEKLSMELGKPVEEDWVAVQALARTVDRSDHVVRKAMEQYRQTNPEWIRTFRTPSGRVREYIAPELQGRLQSELLEHSLALEDWVTQAELTRRIRRRWTTVTNALGPIRESHPEWFRVFRDSAGNLREHLAPELQGFIEDKLEPPKIRREKLEYRLSSFLEEVDKVGSLEAQEFRKLTELFGSEHSLDLLFQHHPDFKKLPVPYVKSVLGDYLGDFYVMRGSFDLETLEIAEGYLTEPNLKDGLFEVLKGEGLSTYNQIKRAHPRAEDQQILEGYIRFLEHETQQIRSEHWREVLEQSDAYYRSLFKIPKPESLVDEIVEDRQFPDVNQRINILELARNNKMLIADEMGLGKSASAILAKESLSVEQALVVVPSNVVDTWETYFSDARGEDGEVLGYFKDGQAPRVLTVNGNDSLQDVNPTDYDYVICSHERLTEENVEILERFDYGMMIVDEVHKLKNLTEGKRAENLIKLTERINGDTEKYLALLSGTPIPNKVSDIAMILKLLYPEKFEDWDNKDLVNEIINGSDRVALRSLLLPRMELKELGESVEMPELDQELHLVGLSEQEREIYDILLEEDEITATQKMQAMRQFVMNPDLLEGTPGVEGTKAQEVGRVLCETFATKDKVVMFVNGYVDGVIEANSKKTTIFESLDLPDDVNIRIISGSVSRTERKEIQDQLKQPGQKMLVVVSGQTADVGVDLTGPDEVFFYNEPWTEYDKKQQLARVYRPGQKHDVTVRTFYAPGTIEEGIHRYIRTKYIAIEKLLHGIPPSELEKELLRKDEKTDSPNLEVNPELAKFYLSKWDNMMTIFGRVKDQGEEWFAERVLKPHGEEYARGYEAMGRRSYQSNANRLAGSLISSFAKRKRQKPEKLKILDIASGPEMLRRHIDDRYEQSVTSIDLNPNHFAEQDEKRIVGSYLSLPIKDRSVHYANLALSFHYSSYRPSKGEYERLEVLKEMNRVLVEGGRAVLTLMDIYEPRDPETLARAVKKLGFRVVERDSGLVESKEGNHFRARVLTLEKVSDCLSDMKDLVASLSPEERGTFKLRREKRSTLRNSRQITTEFRFVDQDRELRARLNDADQRVYESERQALSQMEELRNQFGGVESVPSDEVIEHGFSRVFNGSRYVLFKSLGNHSGAVVVK